jgi:archaellum component FlaF (FlaF/FlaG flagellin family)
MAHVVVTLFTVAAIVAGAVMLSGASLSSANDASAAWERMTSRTGQAFRTELELITADIQGSGQDIDISVRNSGQTSLTDFSWWDVVIEYYSQAGNSDLNIARLSSTSTPPASGQWALEGIFMDAVMEEAEVYERNVLNPGEEMTIRLNISPAIPADTDNLVTIAAPNGIRLAAPFSR